MSFTTDCAFPKLLDSRYSRIFTLLEYSEYADYSTEYSAWILVLWSLWLLHCREYSVFYFGIFLFSILLPCNLFFNYISHLCISVLSCIQTIYKHPWFTSLRRNVKDLAPPSNDLHISWVLSDLRANIHALLLAVWETHIADQAHVAIGCED